MPTFKLTITTDDLPDGTESVNVEPVFDPDLNELVDAGAEIPYSHQLGVQVVRFLMTTPDAEVRAVDDDGNIIEPPEAA